MLFYKFLPKVTLSLLPGTLGTLGLGEGWLMKGEVPVGPAPLGLLGSETRRRPKLLHPEVAISVIRVHWGVCARPSLLSKKYEAEEGFGGAKEHKDGWWRRPLGAVENRDARDVSSEWRLGARRWGRVHKGRPLGADSVLGGARWLRGDSPLVQGSRALCGWRGWRGDAGEGVEAVGVNGRDEGQ